MFTPRVLGPHCVASTFLECTQTLSRALTASMDSCAEMKSHEWSWQRLEEGDRR